MKTEICSQVCLICVFLQSHIHVTFYAVYALEVYILRTTLCVTNFLLQIALLLLLSAYPPNLKPCKKESC